jgi:hypothetical protein
LVGWAGGWVGGWVGGLGDGGAWAGRQGPLPVHGTINPNPPPTHTPTHPTPPLAAAPTQVCSAPPRAASCRGGGTPPGSGPPRSGCTLTQPRTAGRRRARAGGGAVRRGGSAVRRGADPQSGGVHRQSGVCLGAVQRSNPRQHSRSGDPQRAWEVCTALNHPLMKTNTQARKHQSPTLDLQTNWQGANGAGRGGARCGAGRGGAGRGGGVGSPPCPLLWCG